MDFKLFKLDIDELINEFAEGEMTTLADMKKVWLSRKFSFIFEARPSTNLTCFMQSLYAHAIGYMSSSSSLSHRLGGLYCLYCLHETQPFKPPFKIYLSLEELKRLRNLALDAKKKDIKIVAALIKSMLERNLFLLGAVDLNEGSVAERVNELTDMQNARIKVANRKLIANTRIEHFIHMDMTMELDVDLLKKMSTDYAIAKELAIKEASKVVDVQNVKHISENQRLIGDVVENTVEAWNVQKELFYQQIGLGQRDAGKSQQQMGGESSEKQKSSENLDLEELNVDLTTMEDNNNSVEHLDQNAGKGDENEGNSEGELEEELLTLLEF